MLKFNSIVIRLLEAAQEVIKPNSRRYLDIVDAIQSSHLQAIRETCLKNSEIQENVEKSVIHECERLRSFMAAAEVCTFTFDVSFPQTIQSEIRNCRLLTKYLQGQEI